MKQRLKLTFVGQESRETRESAIAAIELFEAEGWAFFWMSVSVRPEDGKAEVDVEMKKGEDAE